MPNELKHVIFGDWRDLAATLKTVVPNYEDLPSEERQSLWKLADSIVNNYAPLKAQCLNCSAVISWSYAYRCADCKSVLCVSCIKPHFGPNHQSHV
jgi:hypothetical protein